MTDTCPSCNKEIICQTKSGKCWCMEYPSILSIESSTSCLCETCLKEKIQAAIQNYIQEIKVGKRINDAFKYAKSPTQVQEGIDYYIENGLFVFTEWYHLKRGNCCDNNCRHCPY